MQNQLNPHFVFNAIGSIMGLISAGESESAKEYLRVFSGMMQHILEKANEPSISLAEDMDQMIQYLRMEQLRFQFLFQVEIDPGIDLSKIELPPQLFQPAIENAVRHGAAGLGANGRVLLHIYAEGDDLCIKITNNALPGKQIRQQGNGMGIRFTNGQIAKLQQLYKGHHIRFGMHITPYQAEANFFFQNWLNPSHQ